MLKIHQNTNRYFNSHDLAVSERGKLEKIDFSRE
jgi:hypothetical protein